MKKHDLEEVFAKLLSRDQPFVFYRLPNTNNVHCNFQDDNSLLLTNDLKINGFVMSRFDSPLPAVYVSAKNHLKFDYKTKAFETKGVINLFHSEHKESVSYTHLTLPTNREV